MKAASFQACSYLSHRTTGLHYACNEDLQIKGILHNSEEEAQEGTRPENSLVLASCSSPHLCKKGSRQVREAWKGKKTSQPEQAVRKQAGKKDRVNDLGTQHHLKQIPKHTQTTFSCLIQLFHF